MVGRPPSPVLVQGTTHIWVEGYEDLPESLHHQLPEKILTALNSGCLTVGGMALSGFIWGKGGDEAPSLWAEDLEGLGLPVVAATAVVASGRLEGISCEIGKIQKGQTHRWVCAYGNTSLLKFAELLRLPRIFDETSGIISLTSKGGAARLRHRLYEQRKQADKKWR